MKISLKRYIALFLVCTLFLASGVFNAAMATGGGADHLFKFDVKYKYTGTVPADAPNPPAKKQYAAGATVTVEPVPTLKGYTFSGWKPESVIVKDNRFIMPCWNVVFEGSWTKNQTYQVTYEYAAGSPAAQLPTDGNQYEKNDLVTLAAPTYAGYTFLGWKLNGKGDYVTSPYKMGCGSVKFVGYWEESPSFGVTYSYAEGSPQAQVPTDDTKYKKDQTVTLKAAPVVPGYTFLGWKLGGAGEYITSYTMGSASVNFVGYWEKNPSFGVTYSYAEGSPQAQVPTDDAKYEKNQTVTLKAAPVVLGYTFLGWKLGGAGEYITSYTMGSASVNFVGYWEKNEVPGPTLYTLTYTFGEGAPSNLNPPGGGFFAAGHLIYLPSIQVPSGFTFLGWFLDGQKLGESLRMPAHNIVIEGRWQAKTPEPTPPPPPQPAALVITYSYVGSVPAGAPAAPALNAYYVGTVVKVAEMPKLEGYVFSGWSTTDVTVTNGAFTLTTNVRFTGSWMAVGMTSQVPRTGDAPALLVGAAMMLAGVAGVCLPLARRRREK